MGLSRLSTKCQIVSTQFAKRWLLEIDRTTFETIVDRLNCLYWLAQCFVGHPASVIASEKLNRKLDWLAVDSQFEAIALLRLRKASFVVADIPARLKKTKSFN